MAIHKSDENKQQKHPVQEKPGQKQAQQGQQQQQGMQRRGEREMSGLGGYGWGNELSPFTMMRRMFEDMDRLFEDFGLGLGAYGRGGTSEGGSAGWWSPQIDVTRRGDSLVITADLPGLSENDVQVEVENGVLSISGERKQEHEEESGGVYRSERHYGSFHREIGLPEGVNPDDATAEFKDGVLEVRFKLSEQKPQSKRIPVGAGGKSESPQPTQIAEGTENAGRTGEHAQPVEGSPELKNIH